MIASIFETTESTEGTEFKKISVSSVLSVVSFGIVVPCLLQEISDEIMAVTPQRF